MVAEVAELLKQLVRVAVEKRSSNSTRIALGSIFLELTCREFSCQVKTFSPLFPRLNIRYINHNIKTCCVFHDVLNRK